MSASALEWWRWPSAWPWNDRVCGVVPLCRRRDCGCRTRAALRAGLLEPRPPRRTPFVLGTGTCRSRSNAWRQRRSHRARSLTRHRRHELGEARGTRTMAAARRALPLLQEASSLLKSSPCELLGPHCRRGRRDRLGRALRGHRRRQRGPVRGARAAPRASSVEARSSPDRARLSAGRAASARWRL
jgi:hypothetical protein